MRSFTRVALFIAPFAVLLSLGSGCPSGDASGSPTPPVAPRSAEAAAETSAHPPGAPSAGEASTGVEVASDGSPPAEPLRPPEAFVTPAPERIVAIGDTHGDLAGLRAALSLAGAVDADGRWAGGALHVVLLGDVLDRGDDEPAMLAWVRTLRTEARQAGGRLWMVLGNHELMNVVGDFRYVTPGGWTGWPEPPADPTLEAVPEPMRARFAAFRPGGPETELLAELPVFLRLGDTLFVHGGLLAEHAAYGLDRINAEVAGWLRGELPMPQRWVMSEESPVWVRAWSGVAEPDCDGLRAALAQAGVRQLVVGHTVQQQGANAACDGAVWRVDTGIAGYYGGNVQVVELRAGRGRVLRAR